MSTDADELTPFFSFTITAVGASSISKSVAQSNVLNALKVKVILAQSASCQSLQSSHAAK